MPQKLPDIVRLDRLLSQISGLSRRQVQAEIRRGSVQVDGITVTDPSRHVPATAGVTLDGTTQARPQPRYFMLNKPAGVVCATTDRNHRTVLDLLTVSNTERLHIAGRLDIDTTGLVLITDDGEWSHHLTSPRHKQPKVYLVTLAEPLLPVAIHQLETGIQLHGEDRPCAPARVEVVSEVSIRLTLTEGKYHQVKRMLAAVGNHVSALHRESIGSIALDPVLAPGESRPLKQAEVVSGMA